VSSTARAPLRCEVWDFRLDPTVGHEQGGTRPCLVVSNNLLNESRAGVVFVVPLSSKTRAIPSHILVDPPEGGLIYPSDIMCEHVRSVSTERLKQYRGDINRDTMLSVETVLRRLFGMLAQ